MIFSFFFRILLHFNNAAGFLVFGHTGYNIPYQSLKIAGYPGIKYFSTAAIAPCELCTLYRVGPQWMQRVPAVVPRGLLLTPPQVYSCQHQSAQVSSVGLKTVILCPFCEKKIDKLRHVQDGKNAVHIKTIISGKIRIFFHTAPMVHSGGGGVGTGT